MRLELLHLRHIAINLNIMADNGLSARACLPFNKGRGGKYSKLRSIIMKVVSALKYSEIFRFNEWICPVQCSGGMTCWMLRSDLVR